MRLFSLVIVVVLAGCAHRGDSQSAAVAEGGTTISVGQPWSQAKRVAVRADYELHDASLLAMIPTPDGFYVNMLGERGLLVFRDPRRDVVASIEWVENWDRPKKFRVYHQVESFEVRVNDAAARQPDTAATGPAFCGPCDSKAARYRLGR